MLAVCSFSSSQPAVLRGFVVDGIGPVLAEEERQIYLLTLELDMVDSECSATFSIVATVVVAIPHLSKKI